MSWVTRRMVTCVFRRNARSASVSSALEKSKLYDLFFGTVSPSASQADPLFALVYRSFERVLRVVRRAIASETGEFHYVSIGIQS